MPKVKIEITQTVRVRGLPNRKEVIKKMIRDFKRNSKNTKAKKGAKNEL